MKEKFAIVVFLAWTLVANVTAQLPVATNLAHCYQKGTRSLDGRPGNAYWQNRADYNITVDFDPATRILKGTVSIEYTNNSPDTLKKLLFKLYPNLYQRQAMRAVAIAPEDLGDGVDIASIRFNNQDLSLMQLKTRGTNMTLAGVTLLPHSKTQFDVTYSYMLNKGSFIRTGQIDTGSFFIAYFFPRIAVYDDVDGWNEYPYTGQYEFYNDYGDFRLAITVPAKYLVWATGELENADSVYSPILNDRIKLALKSDSLTDLVTPQDWRAIKLTRGQITNTWIFTAKNVIDAAFALSNHYEWRTSSILVDPAVGRRTRIDAVYSHEHPNYEKVAFYARKTVDIIDHRFPGIPFPYSHLTVVDGLDAMEYPMMVNDLPFEKPADAIEFTAHEVFHTLLPFYVGSNETKYSFMDEGLATMTEFMFHPLIDSTIPVGNNTIDVDRASGSELDLPIMTLTPQLLGAARYADKDMKPALAFYYLKEVLGDERFNAALGDFITNWAGKHPTPYDLFNCFNTATGQNLNWFWDNWFFHKYVPDLALKYSKGVATILRKGDGMVPIHLLVTYSDGSTRNISKTSACWSSGSRHISISLPRAQMISSIKLGTPFDTDCDRSNNIWSAK